MRKSHIITAAFMLGMLAGCGSGKRVDATSPETVKSSMDAIKASMSESDYKQFQADVSTVTSLGGVPGGVPGLSNPKQKTPADKYKPIDGMTAAEIHAKAEEILASKKKPSK